MKIRVPLSPLLLLIGSTKAWQPSRATASRRSAARGTILHASASTSASSGAVPFVRPERVIRDDIPVVYCYDHCPFCVRVRYVLGLKNIKHGLNFMANDDIPTPTALVGKKIAPILSWKEADVLMAESLDICELVDNDDRLGPTKAILPATDRTDFKEWQSSTRDLLRNLQRPRYVVTGILPEFQQVDGRNAYIRNHQLVGYEKPEWKELSMEDQIAKYDEAFATDPTASLAELNAKLVELDDMLFSEHHCSPGGISYDDVDLFSRLRSITIIKGVVWPTKLGNYMKGMAKLSDIPLYDELAL